MSQPRQYDQTYDLQAWVTAVLGVRNSDGGRGYEQGIRIVSCPLCDDASLDRGRGWVNVVKRRCGCFNAGCPAEGGMTALEYIRRVEGYRTKVETLVMLLREFPSFDLPAPPPLQLATYDDWCTLPPSTPITAHPGRRPSLLYDEVRAFLARQWSLTTADAERWGLRYCVRGRHAWRIIIPITMGGMLVGFQARTFRTGEPKYLMSEHGPQGTDNAECGRPAEALLFNLDAVQEGDDVILVEGAGDAMAVARRISQSGGGSGRAGEARPDPSVGADVPPVAVGLLGLALTDEKASLLAEAQPRRVIVAADAEPAAEARGRVMLEMLAQRGFAAIIGRWRGAKDAGAGAQLRLAHEDLPGMTGLVMSRIGNRKVYPVLQS